MNEAGSLQPLRLVPENWRRRSLLLGAAGAFAASPAWAEWLRDGVVVYAEPALRPVLAVLGTDFQHGHAGTPRVFAAPPEQMLGLLAHGTQADMLITQTMFMDRAERAGLVVAARRSLWRNRLVLAARRGAFPEQKFDTDALRTLVGGGTIAAPDATAASSVDGVGLLRGLGVSAAVQGAADTADAIGMVQSGRAALAVCHATELADDASIGRVMTLPDDAYPAIVYQAALTKSAWSRNQMALLDFLSGDAAARARALGLDVVA